MRFDVFMWKMNPKDRGFETPKLQIIKYTKIVKSVLESEKPEVER
jgi:hypothetical protein